jgi:hypothetical protein
MNDSRAHHLLAKAALLVTLTAVAPAAAEVRRYALVVGANQGQPGEEPLRYAERDAARLAQVLVDVGRVPEANLRLLLGAPAHAVESEVEQLNRSIQRFESAGAGRQSMLLIYYSGHADSGALHLGTSSLRFARLKQLLRQSSADIRVLIIDACQSGDIIRFKGATAAEAFPLEHDDQLAGEGMVILTSSAAGEDAQESDRLRGGFFSHALVTGLQGAADYSGDLRVTLNEAYRYAYTETLRATSAAPRLQHPTYSFQLRGRDDLTLTNLRGQFRGMGRVRLMQAGTYVLFERDAAGPIAAEVSVASPREILLHAGTYVLRRRDGAALYEARVHVREGALTVLESSSLSRVPFALLARRGAAAALSAGGPARPGLDLGVAASIGVGTAVPRGAGVLAQAALGVQLGAGLRSYELELRYGRSQYASTGTPLELNEELLGGQLGAVQYLGSGLLSLGVGLHAGVDRLTQTVAGSEAVVLPVRTAWVGVLGGGLRLAYARRSRISIFLQGDVDLHLLQRERLPEQVTHTALELTPKLRLGLVFHAL